MNALMIPKQWPWLHMLLKMFTHDSCDIKLPVWRQGNEGSVTPRVTKGYKQLWNEKCNSLPNSTHHLGVVLEKPLNITPLIQGINLVEVPNLDPETKLGIRYGCGDSLVQVLPFTQLSIWEYKSVRQVYSSFSYLTAIHTNTLLYTIPMVVHRQHRCAAVWHKQWCTHNCNPLPPHPPPTPTPTPIHTHTHNSLGY